MKHKYKVTVNGATNKTVEAWSAEGAVRIVLRDFIGIERLEVGDIAIIRVERVV